MGAGQTIVVPTSREAVSKYLAECSLRDFVEQAWHVVEPTTPYVHGRHIDAICEHLEAVSKGEIRNLLINIPPRHAKPVPIDELITTTRGRIRLGDVQVGDLVLTHHGRFRRVEAVHEQGPLPVMRITTHSGRVARANDEHPFLTPRGWVQARDLSTNDVLAAVAPDVKTDFGEPLRLEEARLLGYFVGDGTCKEYGGILQSAITCHDDGLAADIFACCEALGFKATWSNGNIPGKRSRINVSGGSRDFLRKHGLAGLGSHTKRVPSAVMNGDKATIANFIAAYLGCDGWIGQKSKARRDCVVSISSVNRDLLTDVQHLYLRLGINSRIRERRAQGGTNFKKVDGDYLYYVLDLTCQTDVWRFQRVVPVISAKGRKLAEWSISPTTFEAILLPDRIVAIDRADDAECRCLTVAEDHSFTVGDLAVHNSLLVCVFWFCWTWIDRPQARWMFASYAQSLSTRDSLKCRRVIGSPWYQRFWGDRWSIVEDQNEKRRFENDKGGYRISTSVGGAATGEGGDYVIVDDPHNVLEGESESETESVKTWWDEVMSTRLNDPQTGSRVIIMQRVSQKDLSGHVLAQGGYEHLMLPAEFESDRKCVTSVGGDWREEDGEVLWPERFAAEALEELKRPLGSFGAAGQLQQRPAPRGGGTFRTDWFETVKGVPVERKRTIRIWDRAATKVKAKNDPDWTVGMKMSRGRDGVFYVEGMVRFRGSPNEVERSILNTASQDGHGVTIVILHDPGQAGKFEFDYYVRALAGYNIRGMKVSKSKEAQVQVADGASSQAEYGNIKLLEAPWNRAFLDEVSVFPAGSHDDIVDCLANGVIWLSSARKLMVA